MKRLQFWIAPLMVVALVASARAQEDEPKVKELTIGSKAPALDVEHWVQDGHGKFKRVTTFADGNVYVVEFWATWCGPCIASMPHLAETQEKYNDKIQIISISDEDLETVEKFLERKVRGEDDRTYRELTSAYCLTTDPDRSNHTNYMKAAGQNGIPTAFIVGKEGHVEWIGHPMTMDEPLEEIVAGKWDREAFREEFAAGQRINKRMRDISAAMRKGDTDKALAVIDDLMKETPKSAQAQLKSMRFSILLAANSDEAMPAAKELLSEMDDAMQVNSFAWMVYQRASAGEINKDLIAIAVEGAEKILPKASAGQNKGYLLDTLAHLKHLQGDTETALKLQKQAVQEAPEAQLKSFLKELEAEKSKGDDDK